MATGGLCFGAHRTYQAYQWYHATGLAHSGRRCVSIGAGRGAPAGTAWHTGAEHCGLCGGSGLTAFDVYVASGPTVLLVLQG